MSDIDVVSSSEGTPSLPQEQIETCIKNLFDVPTKNIQSAFALILGLISEQSSEIDGLKREHAEALENNDRIHSSLQNAVDGLVREKDELSVHLQKLKDDHGTLLQSHETSINTVAELKHEIETLRFNLLGDGCDGEDEQGEEVDSEEVEVDGKEVEVSDSEEVEVVDSEEVEGNGTEEVQVDDSVEGEGDSEGTSEHKQGWVDLGHIALAKVKVSKGKLKADRTVAARLDQLERSLPSLAEKTTAQPIEIDHETLGELSKRVNAVESFLHGLHEDEQISVDEIVTAPLEGEGTESNDDAQTYEKKAATTPTEGETSRPKEDDGQTSIDNAATTPVEREATKEGVDGDSNIITESLSVRNDSASQSSSTAAHVDITERSCSEGNSHVARENVPPRPHQRSSSRRRGSLLSLLDERETRTGLSIDDLAQQISDLRKSIDDQQLAPLNTTFDPGEIQKQVEELIEGLQKQVTDLTSFVGNKVSREDLEARIQETQNGISNHSIAEPVDTPAGSTEVLNELAMVKKQILDQLSKLESEKLDKGVLEQQLQQMEQGIKSLLGQEITKQQHEISTSAEKTESDLTEIRSMIDAQKDAILCLGDGAQMSSNIDTSVKEEEMNARIQQATDALRVSLEERLDELRSIESEMDGFASKLAEKPSQDQIDSMLHDLEKRLGQDEALQIILANMKIELKQRMTRGEVMTLVKQTFRDAKLGIQNTKDTLMIGRIPYCLGCSQPFPAGVNGIKAPKMNHDSLPPASGLVSNATLYGSGSRRSLRPLQALRSAPQRQRPKSAIIGRFSPSSALRSNHSR